MGELTREDADAFVFNHWHELLPLSAVDRYLLPLLDGRRDRQALVETLMDVVDQRRRRSQGFLNPVDSKWLSICNRLHSPRTWPPQSLTMSAP
jgi:hypothetical protein